MRTEAFFPSTDGGEARVVGLGGGGSEEEVKICCKSTFFHGRRVLLVNKMCLGLLGTRFSNK